MRRKVADSRMVEESTLKEAVLDEGVSWKANWSADIYTAMKSSPTRTQMGHCALYLAGHSPVLSLSSHSQSTDTNLSIPSALGQM